MDVSARDINDKEFLLAFRGYNQDDVDDFLDQVAETMDRLERENKVLRARVEELDATAKSARATEEMLKKTLMNAQETAEETITEARTKAEQLMAETEERVRRADEDVRQRLAAAEEEAQQKTGELQSRFDARKHELESSLERLETFESEIKHRLRSFMEQQLQALETLHEKERAAVPVAPAGDEVPAERKPTPSAPPEASSSSAVPDDTQEHQTFVDDEDQGLVEEMAGPGEDDASLFNELASEQRDNADEPPLDDFKPFDDDAALQGRRRRGLFRRNRVDDWA